MSINPPELPDRPLSFAFVRRGSSSLKTTHMNGNALKGKSTIEVKETKCGGLHDGIGFSRTDGWIMSQDEHYAELEKNGYKVERTSHGVIITKITDNE